MPDRKDERPMRIKRFLSILLMAGLLVSGSAAASRYGYPVDQEVMKALEQQSSCPVRVTEKKIVLECFDRESFSKDGADALVITVTNGSDTVLRSVKIGFIAVDEDGLTTDVASSMSMVYAPGASPEIKTVSREGLALAPGESCAVSTRVDYSRFKTVRAMVSEYETEDGSVVVNPDFERWQVYAFGLSSDSSTELD